MYNILIVSHGDIAKGYLNTAEMIMREVENVMAIGIQPGEGTEDYGDKVFKVANELYTKDGLLILTDLYGGTPCNICISRILPYFAKVQIIAGFNLPILLEALGSRNNSLEESINTLLDIGNMGIVDVNTIVKNKRIDDEDE